jgi:hypothetical protein
MRMLWLIIQYNYPSINIGNYMCQHVPSKAWVFGRSLDGIVCSNSAGAWKSCYVLSRTGFCVGLITPKEEYYRMWCV